MQNACIYTCDTDHGYRKEMVRENVCCITHSCQLSFTVVRISFIKMIVAVLDNS